MLFKTVLENGIKSLDEQIIINHVDILLNSNPIYNNESLYGAVVSLRDQSEMKQLITELSGTEKYNDSLREQSHHFMNKLHVLQGLIELKSYDDVEKYITYLKNDYHEKIGHITENIKVPSIAGFLLAKEREAREKSIKLSIDSDSAICQQGGLETLYNELVIILGVLIDNAFDALKNKDNEYISVFENKKFALFNYVEGKIIEKIDTHIIREIATYLGKLHAFTKDIRPEKYNRKTRLDFNYFYDKISQSDIDLQDKEKLLNLASEIKDYDFSQLESGIIHGDIFPDNVLFDEKNNLKVILDFNESYYAPFIFDLAVVINFWIKINNFDFFTENNFIRDFLNYYSK